MFVRQLPRVYRGLPRPVLTTPRHPPCALRSLTTPTRPRAASRDRSLEAARDGPCVVPKRPAEVRPRVRLATLASAPSSSATFISADASGREPGRVALVSSSILRVRSIESAVILLRRRRPIHPRMHESSTFGCHDHALSTARVRVLYPDFRIVKESPAAEFPRRAGRRPGSEAVPRGTAPPTLKKHLLLKENLT